MTYGDRLTVMQITEHKFTLELKKKKTRVLSVGTLEDLLCFLKNYFFSPYFGRMASYRPTYFEVFRERLGNWERGED